MTQFRIIYTRPEDGGVDIIVPAPGVTVEQAAAGVPEGVLHEVVNDSDIPTDRTFRDAWNRSGKQIGIDMPKAKEIAHSKRRAARAAELTPLDIEATIPAKAQEAEAKRQAIRDKYAAIQAQIDVCTTPDQLKSIIEASVL